MNMRSRTLKTGALLAAAAVAFAAFGLQVAAQDKDKGKPDPSAMLQLRIEVTAGEKSAPVDMASVYVKFLVKRVIGKDQQVEMNIKTNKEGVAVAPSVQRGKVLVQVIAEGWKPYGNWFDVTEDGQTVKIKLERPPRWY
jgi:hypothetical protein